jgi:hypothetical protein
MDLKTKEDIQFHALSVFSEGLVRARAHIQVINEKIRNPSTETNIKATLHATLRNSMQSYDSLRIKQAKNKQNVLKVLFGKYPSLDQDDIQKCLDMAVNDYETEEYNSNPVIYTTKEDAKEQATITIPIYTQPAAKQDMAVLLVYFNACSYKKLAQNLCLVYQTLVRSGIPVYLVEHCFKDQVPLFPENGTTIFNTRSESYMFYKENLLNWLMPKVPAQYTKFFMMDCDLFFEKESWYDDVSALLDTHDVVQPFQTAVWLGSDLKTIILKRDGVVYINTVEEPALARHHPGFAWAFRRDFIESKRIYDINIMGSGDTIIGAAVLQKDILSNIWRQNSSEWMLEKYKAYYKSFENTRVCFYKEDVYHLWHGSKKNREYDTRYESFQKFCLDHNIVEQDDLFSSRNGIYEFKPEIRDEINAIFLKYFESRSEDGI